MHFDANKRTSFSARMWPMCQSVVIFVPVSHHHESVGYTLPTTLGHGARLAATGYVLFSFRNGILHLASTI